MEAIDETILIIEGPSRFKVVSKYIPIIADYCKTLEGRFYDFPAKLWSFPIESFEKFVAFLDERMFSFKTVQLNKYVSIYKTSTALQLKFGGYQESFSIFQQLEGSAYDRSLSMYVIPIEHLEHLEKILEDNEFSYQIIKKAILQSKNGPKTLLV